MYDTLGKIVGNTEYGASSPVNSDRRERREKRDALMMIPTLDQTEGIWIGRTSGQGFHYVQNVFPGDTPHERWHRANCHILIAQGHLQPEHEGVVHRPQEHGIGPDDTGKFIYEMTRHRNTRAHTSCVVYLAFAQSNGSHVTRYRLKGTGV